MIHLTKADAQWLKKLLDTTEWIQKEYPELFSLEEDEMLKIVGELIRRIN